MIVDDDREIRSQMSRILRPRGYHLDFAANGESCLSSAQRVIPDLVILDLGLPGEDGLTIIRKMREIESISDIPVLVVTGRDPAVFKQVVMDEAVAGFFSKPILESSFLKAVEDVLVSSKTVLPLAALASDSSSPAVSPSSVVSSSSANSNDSADCPHCGNLSSNFVGDFDPRMIDSIAERVAAIVIDSIRPMVSALASGSGSQPPKVSGPPIYVEVEEGLEDLLPGFFGRRSDDCKALQRALEVRDFATVELLGHRMSGNGGGFGCHRVSEIGAALEQAAKKSDAAETQSLISSLYDFLARVELAPPTVSL